MELDCLKCEKLILGGDLNFSMGLSEIRGTRARLDSLSDSFIKYLETFGLVDIVPSVMLPTWTNRRVGAKRICNDHPEWTSKKLEIFHSRNMLKKKTDQVPTIMGRMCSRIRKNNS